MHIYKSVFLLRVRLKVFYTTCPLVHCVRDSSKSQACPWIPLILCVVLRAISSLTLLIVSSLTLEVSPISLERVDLVVCNQFSKTKRI